MRLDLSALMPLRDLDAAAASSHALVVVGGGIQGAMTTLEAARLGLKPLLIDKGPFGAATTGNSLGIVHGGLRYLQSLDLARHHRSATECHRLLKEYPDHVVPLPCLLPLYGGGLERPWLMRGALALHHRLTRWAGSTVLPRPKILGSTAVSQWCAELSPNGLRGGALWYEGSLTDAGGLLREILRRACRLGATVLDRVEATDLIVRKGQVAGVAARDCVSGATLPFHAPVVINCAGPWAATLARHFDPATPRLFDTILACNLLLDRPPPSPALLALKPGPGPALFARPWRARLVLGTRYRPWPDGAPLRAPEDMIDAMLRDLNTALPELRATRDQVAAVQLGLLPGVGGRLAQRDILRDHGRAGGINGLYTAAGVKLTTARALAERLLRRIYPGFAGV